MARIVITIDTCGDDRLADLPAAVETEQRINKRTPVSSASMLRPARFQEHSLDHVGVFDSDAAPTVSLSERAGVGATAGDGSQGDLGRHIDAICKTAGLNIMVEVFEIVLDRELLNPDAVFSLCAADIQVLYDRFIEPAFDQVESNLVARAHGHGG